MEFDELSNQVIGCAIEVHKRLGPGLLESSYERCLSFELICAGIHHDVQKELPIEYKKIKLDCGYRVDLMIRNEIIVELKSVDRVLPIHEAQLLTYMKLADKKIGLWNSENLIEAILRNYEKLSEEIQAELPLKRIWVMVSEE